MPPWLRNGLFTYLVVTIRDARNADEVRHLRPYRIRTTIIKMLSDGTVNSREYDDTTQNRYPGAGGYY